MFIFLLLWRFAYIDSVSLVHHRLQKKNDFKMKQFRFVIDFCAAALHKSYENNKIKEAELLENASRRNIASTVAADALQYEQTLNTKSAFCESYKF